MRTAHLAGGRCQPCDKVSYPDRRTARRARHTMHSGHPGIEAYPCPAGTGRWHIGHSQRRMRRAA